MPPMSAALASSPRPSQGPRVVDVEVVCGSNVVANCVVNVAVGVNHIGALILCTESEKILELVDDMPFVTAVVRALVFVLANAA